MFDICYSWNFKSTTDFLLSFNEYFCYFASPRRFISSSAFITRTWIEVLPQSNKMFSKCFHFVILTVIFLLLQGTFLSFITCIYISCALKHAVGTSVMNITSNGNYYKSKQDTTRSVVARTMERCNFKYKYTTKEELYSLFFRKYYVLK